MRKIITLIIVISLSGCGLVPKNTTPVIKKDKQTNSSYNGHMQNSIKLGKITSSKENYINKYTSHINQNLILGDKKVLSGIELVLEQIQSNIQTLNKEELKEFKKMLTLYQENLNLMQKLIFLEKKSFTCFANKNKAFQLQKIINIPQNKIINPENKDKKQPITLPKQIQHNLNTLQQKAKIPDNKTIKGTGNSIINHNNAHSQQHINLKESSIKDKKGF